MSYFLLGRQVYCPIPYVSYHPKILQWLNKSFAKSNVAKMSGYFDENNNDFVSFFVQDYKIALKKIKNQTGMNFHTTVGKEDSIIV
jgi:hypothetical protein